jgi:hypothetical protein
MPYSPTMSTRSGGPNTDAGKAVTRLNACPEWERSVGWTRRAAKYGIYSVTPVVPAFERERDWRAHHAEVFADLAPEGYVQEIIAERIAIKVGRMPRTSTDSNT